MIAKSSIGLSLDKVSWEINGFCCVFSVHYMKECFANKSLPPLLFFSIIFFLQISMIVCCPTKTMLIRFFCCLLFSNPLFCTQLIHCARRGYRWGQKGGVVGLSKLPMHWGARLPAIDPQDMFNPKKGQKWCWSLKDKVRLVIDPPNTFHTHTLHKI